jgi:ATP phosphoribosyltransferase
VLTIALPKGRLQKKVLERFAAAGLVPEEEPGASRRLIIPAQRPPGGGDGASAARFIVLKDGDVPLYVERGAADLGVCGFDQLLESGADVLAPLDLGFGRCRLCLAGPRRPAESGAARPDPFAALADATPPGRSLRIGTKYPRLAARAFAQHGVPVDLVRLSGSVELAAVAGLADAIVDLVETGRTLEENGLAVLADLLAVSARLVVNRAAWRLKLEELRPVLDRLPQDAGPVPRGAP